MIELRLGDRVATVEAYGCGLVTESGRTRVGGKDLLADLGVRWVHPV